jgi:hypothetical protein
MRWPSGNIDLRGRRHVTVTTAAVAIAYLYWGEIHGSEASDATDNSQGAVVKSAPDRH